MPRRRGDVSDYPLLDVFLTMMWFFIWLLWISLVFRIILDIFRNHELGGWGKAGWLVLVVLVPFIGVLVYLVAHGGRMAARDYGIQRAHDEVYNENFRDSSRRV
jgi:Phospholipase_D-nuclease N-terminal